MSDIIVARHKLIIIAIERMKTKGPLKVFPAGCPVKTSYTLEGKHLNARC